MTERDDEVTVRELLEEAGARPEVPRDDLDAIVAAGRSEWAARWGREARRSGRGTEGRRRIAAAALLAATLAVALGLAWWWRGTRSAGEAPAVVARVEAVTGPVGLAAGEEEPRELAVGDPVPAGTLLRTGGARLGPLGRASLRLADGTTVRVDAGTDVHVVSLQVLILDQGVVYVDTGTAEEPAGAIEVRTPLATVRDVGTRFAVRAMGGARGSVRVQVREGAVEMAREGRTYRAGAGEELVVRSDRPVERRAVPVRGRDWEWVIAAAPPFELEGSTLRELLDWVSRETGWRVLYEDDALAAAADEIVLHGSLGDLRADQAAFTVLPGAGLEGELGGGVLLVRRPSEN